MHHPTIVILHVGRHHPAGQARLSLICSSGRYGLSKILCGRGAAPPFTMTTPPPGFMPDRNIDVPSCALKPAAGDERSQGRTPAKHPDRPSTSRGESERAAARSFAASRHWREPARRARGELP